MPNYYKQDEQYIVNVITGPAHVCLGLKFNNSEDREILIVSKNATREYKHGKLDELQIKQCTLEGIEIANNRFNGRLKISEIHYIKDDTPRYDIYRRCAYLIAEGILCDFEFEAIK